MAYDGPHTLEFLDGGHGTIAQKSPGPHHQDMISANKGQERIHIGNAMHAVRTRCEILDVGKYANLSFGPFSQVFGPVPGFF